MVRYGLGYGPSERLLGPYGKRNLLRQSVFLFHLFPFLPVTMTYFPLSEIVSLPDSSKAMRAGASYDDF